MRIAEPKKALNTVRESCVDGFGSVADGVKATLRNARRLSSTWHVLDGVTEAVNDLADVTKPVNIMLDTAARHFGALAVLSQSDRRGTETFASPCLRHSTG